MKLIFPTLFLLSLPAVDAFAAPTRNAPSPASSLVLSTSDKKADALVKQLRDGSPEDKVAALKTIASLGRKAPSEVRSLLVQELAGPTAQGVSMAIDAIEAIGKPMTKTLKTTLEEGACEGVPVPLRRVARATLRLDPSGKRFLAKYLESHPLTPGVATEIREYAEPKAGLRLLASQLGVESNRSAAMLAIRGMRHRKELADREAVSRILDSAIKGSAEEIDGSIALMAEDALLGIDAVKDRARMSDWLGSSDPVLQESALWSVGLTGRPLVDLAPVVGRHLTSSDPKVAGVAHWVIGSLKEDGGTCHVPNLFSLSNRTIGIAGGAGMRPNAVHTMRLVGVISQVEDGVLRRPPVSATSSGRRLRAKLGRGKTPAERELREHAVEIWSFAPGWIDDYRGSRGSAPAPGDVEQPEPIEMSPAIEALMPTLVASLGSPDKSVSLAAGMALLEWNAVSDEVLAWCLDASSRPSEELALSLVQDFLMRHASHPFLGSEESVQKLVAWFASLRAAGSAWDASTVFTILCRTPGVHSKAAIDRHFRGMDPARAWGSSREYYDAWDALNQGHADIESLVAVTGARFVAGDYRMAPFLVRAGDLAHPALEKVLASGTLDQQMTAVAILQKQGANGSALLPKLQSLQVSKDYAQAFLSAAVKELAAK